MYIQYLHSTKDICRVLFCLIVEEDNKVNNTNLLKEVKKGRNDNGNNYDIDDGGFYRRSYRRCSAITSPYYSVISGLEHSLVSFRALGQYRRLTGAIDLYRFLDE
jgi:hypothetical protein